MASWLHQLKRLTLVMLYMVPHVDLALDFGSIEFRHLPGQQRMHYAYERHFGLTSRFFDSANP